MELMTSTGLREPEIVGLAMITGLVLTSYLIARYGVSQGKSFWQVFSLSLLGGPVVGAVIAAMPGAAPATNPRQGGSLRP